MSTLVYEMLEKHATRLEESVGYLQNSKKGLEEDLVRVDADIDEANKKIEEIKSFLGGVNR